MEERKCCPAAELMQYLVDNYSAETRKLLKFHRKFVDAAESTIRSVAEKIGRPVDEITFVGIHNRRTVRLQKKTQRWCCGSVVNSLVNGFQGP